MNCPECATPFEEEVTNPLVIECPICHFEGAAVEWDYGEPDDELEDA